MTRKRNIEPEISVSAPGSSAVPARRKGSSRNRTKHVPAPAEATVNSEPETSTAKPQLTAAQLEGVSDGPAAQAVDTPVSYKPTHEEIAAVAFEYWIARGCQGGSADEDWLRAEQELRRARSLTA